MADPKYSPWARMKKSSKSEVKASGNDAWNEKNKIKSTTEEELEKETEDGGEAKKKQIYEYEDEIIIRRPRR